MQIYVRANMLAAASEALGVTSVMVVTQVVCRRREEWRDNQFEKLVTLRVRFIRFEPCHVRCACAPATCPVLLL